MSVTAAAFAGSTEASVAVVVASGTEDPPAAPDPAERVDRQHVSSSTPARTRIEMAVFRDVVLIVSPFVWFRFGSRRVLSWRHHGTAGLEHAGRVAQVAQVLEGIAAHRQQ